MGGAVGGGKLEDVFEVLGRVRPFARVGSPAACDEDVERVAGSGIAGVVETSACALGAFARRNDVRMRAHPQAVVHGVGVPMRVAA